MRQQGPAPIGIEFGEDIVEQQDRRGSCALGDHPVGGQSQGQRKGTLFPLRGVGAGRESVDSEQQFIAMRSYERGSPPQFIAPGCVEGSGQAIGAPWGVVVGHHICRTSGYIVVGPGQHRGHIGDQGGPGIGERFTGFDEF